MTDPYRVLVTGSRNWTDYETVLFEIAARALLHKPLVVVHGAARGADALAARAAIETGVRAEVHRADWNAHGKRAGMVRNERMVSLGADVCLVFQMPCTVASCRRSEPHGSHGTENCVRLAEKAGIPVRRFRG